MVIAGAPPPRSPGLPQPHFWALSPSRKSSLIQSCQASIFLIFGPSDYAFIYSSSLTKSLFKPFYSYSLGIVRFLPSEGDRGQDRPEFKSWLEQLQTVCPRKTTLFLNFLI